MFKWLGRKAFSSAENAPKEDPKAPMVMQMGVHGMFACISHIAHFARIADEEGRTFVVLGRNSLYRDPSRPGNPWLYYFEPVFPDAQLGDKPVNVRSRYKNQGLANDHLIAPRMVAGVRDSLELPKDRHAACKALARYIRLNKTTQAFIDDFAATFFSGPVIGLHIRGAGRIHGGAAELRALLDPENEIPFEHYFRAVDEARKDYPEARIFACSDSQDVIDRVRERYGDNTLVYPASRSRFGEMHEGHEENAGQSFSPYKLGLDVIVEAHLLARCNHFVHGNSNVANYVLCRNPELGHTYIYAGVQEKLRAHLLKMHGASTAA